MPRVIGEAGVSHVEGCYAIGAVARLFQMRLDNLHHILKTFVLEQYRYANIKAAAMGYDFIAKHLQKPHRPESDHMIVTGVKTSVSVRPKNRFVRPVI
jgi:Pyruvate/2-oxoacid:ferredoxin oxidoreductase gamma subunit